MAYLTLIFKFLVALIVISEVLSETTESYDTKFDNVDIEEVLANDRLLGNYVKCLEFEGPCTPDGKMLRDNLPDAILTNCSKCSAKQKFGSDKVTHYLIDNKPSDWDRLELIYDPEGTYRKAYLEGKSKMTEKSNDDHDNANAHDNDGGESDQKN